MQNDKVWECRIGGDVKLPPGSDGPMRDAVERAFRDLTGQEPRGVFTGWGNKWTDLEIDCLTPRDNSPCSPELRARFEAHGVRFAEEVVGHDGLPPRAGRPSTTMHPVYGTDGSYITDAVVDGAHLRWLAERGIWNPLGTGKPGTTARIGLATEGEYVGKWFGWSHRAAHGFAVGDVVKEGDCAARPGWTAEHLAENPDDDRSLPVGFVCQTPEDCRRAAEAFAEAVG